MDAAEVVRVVDKGYAVGWFTLAMINAGLAQAKGRSRFVWFLGSLIGGPLATFLVVATDNPKPKATVSAA
jgi:hypothetical protein